MAQSHDATIQAQLQEALVDDPDFLKNLVSTVLQQFLENEISRFLEAEPHQRIETRRGYRCGYYERDLITRVGQITLRVPRDREGQFSTRLFAGYQRSEKAFLLALLDMYVHGVSTRKVKKITEALCVVSVSKSQVSELSKELDEELELWRRRALKPYYPYLYIDGTYYKVRQEGRVVSMAALVVMGVNPQGRRELLATEVVHEENAADYRTLLRSLKARGLGRVDLVIGDDHAGLKQALAHEFPRSGKQRCLVHFLRNLSQKLPESRRAESRAQLNSVLKASCHRVAERELADLVTQIADWDSRLADWLEEAGSELLAHMSFPRSHWLKIRSTNMLERVNQELRRRIQVLRIFPNRESCLRLVTALAVEFDEEWQTGRRYLNMALMAEDSSEKPIRKAS